MRRLSLPLGSGSGSPSGSSPRSCTVVASRIRSFSSACNSATGSFTSRCAWHDHAMLAGGLRPTICSAGKCSVVHCAKSHSILAAMLSHSPDFGAAQDRDHLLTEQGDRLGAAPIHRAPKDRQKVAGPAAAALLDDLLGHLSWCAGNELVLVYREAGASLGRIEERG